MEIRFDPITSRAVIIAEDRAARPCDFVLPEPVDEESNQDCPFCVGNEGQTPGEIDAFRSEGSEADQSGWNVRVVPNKYPAVRQSVSPEPIKYEGPSEHQFLSAIGGFGSHEVIIDTAEHLASVSQLSTAQYTDVLRMYRRRLLDLGQDKRLAYGLIFKNVGPAAGASLVHSHSQLIATPIVPSVIEEELQGAAKYQVRHGRCVWCDLIERARADGRVVMESDRFVAICPYAPRFPLETHVLPTFHVRQFEASTEDLLAEMSEMTVCLIGKIETTLGIIAYNYLIHTSPFDFAETRQYHWHVEIIPRTTSIAGFEWGSGYYINPVPPELAAAKLREV